MEQFPTYKSTKDGAILIGKILPSSQFVFIANIILYKPDWIRVESQVILTEDKFIYSLIFAQLVLGQKYLAGGEYIKYFQYKLIKTNRYELRTFGGSYKLLFQIYPHSQT